MGYPQMPPQLRARLSGLAVSRVIVYLLDYHVVYGSLYHMSESLETLTAMRKQKLEELVNLVPEASQREAHNLVRDIGALEEAIEQMRPNARPGRFSSYRWAIDAIIDLLKERGTPAKREEIASAISAGGFRGNAPGTKILVQKSIVAFIKGTGAPTKKLREVGDLIGLGEWDDSRFTPET